MKEHRYVDLTGICADCGEVWVSLASSCPGPVTLESSAAADTPPVFGPLDPEQATEALKRLGINAYIEQVSREGLVIDGWLSKHDLRRALEIMERIP